MGCTSGVAYLESSHTWCQNCCSSFSVLEGKSTMALSSCHPGKCQQKWDWRKLLVLLGAFPCLSSIYLDAPCPASTNVMQVILNIQTLIETKPAPGQWHMAVPLASGFQFLVDQEGWRPGRLQAGIPAGGQVQKGVFWG